MEDDSREDLDDSEPPEAKRRKKNYKKNTICLSATRRYRFRQEWLEDVSFKGWIVRSSDIEVMGSCRSTSVDYAAYVNYAMLKYFQIG